MRFRTLAAATLLAAMVVVTGSALADWTTPKTWQGPPTPDPLSESNLNTYVRDNQLFLYANASRMLWVDTSDSATSGTSATDLWTETLPANTLADGETLVVEALGDQTGDTNTKTFGVVLGSTTVTDNYTSNDTTFTVYVRITRVSASATRGVNVARERDATYFTTAEDLTTALTLKLTGQHATSGTSTLRVIRVWVEGAGL